MKVTAREVADYLGIDYVVASGLMTALCDKGLAKHVENRKHPTGKGKPTRVFEVDQKITLEMFASSNSSVQVQEEVQEKVQIEEMEEAGAE